MRTRVFIRIFILLLVAAIDCEEGKAQAPQKVEYGPLIRARLDLMHDEEVELEFQVERREISRKDYLRSKNKIAIMRETLIDIFNETGEDNVPELHVVAASEVDQLIEGGLKAVRGARPGSMIESRWRYIGSVTRGEVFYILERVPRPR